MRMRRFVSEFKISIVVPLYELITVHLLVTCQLRSFLGLASQIHHIIISTNTRFRSGNKFNFNIFPMIVQSNFKTIYICCIYYAFRKCIPMGYYSLGKTVFSSICTTMLLVYLVYMSSCSCSIIFGEYGVDFDFVHTLYDLKSFYYICSDSPILQCWQPRGVLIYCHN